MTAADAGTQQAADPGAAAADEAAFRRYLRAHNLPATAQRLAIAAVVLGTDRHLSADEVAIELRARGQHAGTATVYRTLEVLQRSGLVVARDFGEGFKRFEASRNSVTRPQAVHSRCSWCGTPRDASKRLNPSPKSRATTRPLRWSTSSVR
jgi:Fe2+ or Zn2+ uptake regulation protein